jgi:hypothetical protein
MDAYEACAEAEARRGHAAPLAATDGWKNIGKHVVTYAPSVGNRLAYSLGLSWYRHRESTAPVTVYEKRDHTGLILSWRDSLGRTIVSYRD